MAKEVLLAITIPCFNEAQNIPIILKKFKELTEIYKLNKNNKKDIELIIVNNGSNDNSTKILKEAKKKYDFLKVIYIKKNKGYGHGILCGLHSSNSHYCGWTHADLQTDMVDVFKAYEIIKNNKDKKLYIKGVRSGRNFDDRFFSKAMSIILSIFFRKSLFEINAQPNIFNIELLKKMGNPPNDFSFDLYTYILAIENHYVFKRFKVYFYKRIYGNSKWNFGLSSRVKFILRTISYSIKLRSNINKKFS